MRRGKVCEAEYVRQFALSIKQLISPRWRELVARASTVQ